jgi:CRP-like cAMP-binding protein
MKESITVQETDHTAFGIIRSEGVLHSIPPNMEIFRQEQVIREVILLEQGKVKMARTEYFGNEMIVEISEPMQILGITSALSGLPATVTATTLTMCRIFSLNAHLFRTLVEQKPDFAKCLLRLVSRYSHEQVIRYAQLGMTSSRYRLANFLLKHISYGIPHKNGRVRINIPFKKVDVASLLAVRPEHLSRLLAELKSKGVIEQERGWIIVTDLEKLRLEAAR